jgi:hypothetical protein
MALRFSTGLRNYMMNHGSFKEAFNGGRLLIYTGTQPTLADDAATGTLLCTISLASGAITNETLATGTLHISVAGTGGYVTNLKVSGVELLSTSVAYSASLSTTASLVASAINSYTTWPDYMAVWSSNYVVVTAKPGTGTGPNTFALSTAVSGGTISVAVSDMSGGVAAVNGITFGGSDAGVIAKGTGVWSGVNGNTGTAGWFRLCSAIADAGTSSTTAIRMDGNIASSGANLNMTTSLTATATTTIDTASLTFPAS